MYMYTDKFRIVRTPWHKHGHPRGVWLPQSSPQSEILTTALVFPLSLPNFSIFCTTSIPFVTFPKTTCLPSSQSVLTVQRKNCDPFVFGPALAMERMPGPVCLRVKFSSANLFP